MYRPRVAFVPKTVRYLTPFWATVYKTVRPVLSDRCLSVCRLCPVCLSVRPVCDVGILWPNGWMDQDETWHGGTPRPWRHCVRWGPSSSSQKGAEPPIFGQLLLWPNVWMDQDGTWHGGGLGPGHIVLDADPAFPPQKGGQPPPTIFGPFLLWLNRWMHQDATWYGGRPRSRRYCARRWPNPPQKKGTATIFGPCLLWPNGRPSAATAELLLRSWWEECDGQSCRSVELH